MTQGFGFLYGIIVTPLEVARLYQIGYTITFLLGFLGNTASLLTFSRPTLRKVSTGCLFIMLAISDMIYLCMCFIDYLEFGLQVVYYGHLDYNKFCRFRTFVINVAQVSSAWILVIVSLDRWIRTRFPFKSGSLCTPKKALLAVGVMLIMNIGLNSHILTPMFGMLIPGFAVGACGPDFSNLSYTLFYYLKWSVIQIFTTCMIPVLLMFSILIDIFISIRTRKRAVIQPTQVLGDTQNTNRQGNLQKQMFILMFASIFIFLITNLPIAIYKSIALQTSSLENTFTQISTVWAALAWFQSLNYAINFYIHCLSSTLFRKEFKQQMQIIFRTNLTPVTVMDITKTGLRVQTKQVSMRY